MLKNINWVTIKGEFERAKGQLNIADNTPIALNIVPKHGEAVTRRILFKDFLEAMWRIYDSHTEITKVSATPKDGESFFQYDTLPDDRAVEQKPLHGNGAIILEFKNLTQNAKEVYINILLTQILEDQTCTQNNSTPPNGSPS